MNEAEAKDRLIDVMRENSDLRAKLNDNHAASCVDAGVILELRARVSEMEARYDNVTVALKEKCAELTAIKPDWSSAPKWAARHIIKSFYLDEFNETGNPTRIVEARPEET